MSSGQHKVFDYIRFLGEANNSPNVKGNFSPERLTFVEHFVKKALNTTDDETTYLDGDSTVALAPAATASGIVTLTTLATISKTCSYAGQLVLYPAMNPAVEWRIAIDDISNLRMVVGLNDQTDEASGILPFSISGTVITDICTDGVAFVFDVAQETKYWYVANKKNGVAVGGTLLASKYTPENDKYVTLRIALNTDGDATYYYNGKAVAFKENAVTNTVGFCPYIGIRNANASIHVLSADYYKIWGD